jgi:hypothetical protein
MPAVARLQNELNKVVCDGFQVIEAERAASAGLMRYAVDGAVATSRGEPLARGGADRRGALRAPLAAWRDSRRRAVGHSATSFGALVALVLASHGQLDAMTDGGMGVACFG